MVPAGTGNDVARGLGSGMHITPGARLDDGELDLLLVAPLGRLLFLAVVPKVFRGRHVGLPVVRIERVRSVRIEASVPVIDYGTPSGWGPLPLELEVVPDALRVLAPDRPFWPRTAVPLYSMRRSAPNGPIV